MKGLTNMFNMGLEARRTNSKTNKGPVGQIEKEKHDHNIPKLYAGKLPGSFFNSVSDDLMIWWYPAVLQAYKIPPLNPNLLIYQWENDGKWGCSMKNWCVDLQRVLDHHFWKRQYSTICLPLMSNKIEPDNLPNQGLPKCSPAQQWPRRLRHCEDSVMRQWRSKGLTSSPMMACERMMVCECMWTVYCHDNRSCMYKLFMIFVEVHDSNSKIQLASRSCSFKALVRARVPIFLLASTVVMRMFADCHGSFKWAWKTRWSMGVHIEAVTDIISSLCTARLQKTLAQPSNAKNKKYRPNKPK